MLGRGDGRVRQVAMADPHQTDDRSLSLTTERVVMAPRRGSQQRRGRRRGPRPTPSLKPGDSEALAQKIGAPFNYNALFLKDG